MLLIEKILFSTQSLIPLIVSEHDQEEMQGIDELDEDEDELALKNVISAKGKFASFMQIRNSNILV